MQVIEIAGLPPVNDEPCNLAIGKFDGIHLGHQRILSTAGELGPGLELAVMTFHPHPAWALGRKPGYERWLTPPREQERILAGYGVSRIYRIHFGREYATTSAEDFVNEHLQRLSIREVVIGSDFRFGKGAAAGWREMQELSSERGIGVRVVSPVESSGQKVSSSAIRSLLARGHVRQASEFLGRPHTLEGEVVRGDQVGRTLSFPTANLSKLDDYFLPMSGVYAVSADVLLNGRWVKRLGVANLGTRPTVSGSEFRVEVHLFDFHEDIYGGRVRLYFHERIRAEQKFASLDSLRQQIEADVETARRHLQDVLV